MCDDTGYITGPTQTRHRHNGEPVNYSTVTNCRCTTGQHNWNAGTEQQGELLT